MSDKNFVKKYLEDYASLIKPNEKIIEKIIDIFNYSNYGI